MKQEKTDFLQEVACFAVSSHMYKYFGDYKVSGKKYQNELHKVFVYTDRCISAYNRGLITAEETFRDLVEIANKRKVEVQL